MLRKIFQRKTANIHITDIGGLENLIYWDGLFLGNRAVNGEDHN